MKRPLFIAISCIFFILSVQTRSFGRYEYQNRNRRDPFIPLTVSSEANTPFGGLATVQSIEDVRLEGIMFDPSGKSIAVLNGDVVGEGERVYNVEVVKISQNAVTVKLFGRFYKINFIEEGK